MGKSKSPATGEGYLGEVMVHRTSGVVGIVENVVPGSTGWPPAVTLKLKDGTLRKGRLGEFREPRSIEREQFSPA